MKNWLSGFAYRIEQLDYWYLYVLGGIATGTIALATIVVKTLRSSLINPIESIRNE